MLFKLQNANWDNIIVFEVGTFPLFSFQFQVASGAFAFQQQYFVI